MFIRDWILRIFLGCAATISGTILWYWGTVATIPLIAITLGSGGALIGLVIFDRADDKATQVITAAITRKEMEVTKLLVDYRTQMQETLQIEVAPYRRLRDERGVFVPDPPEVKEARAEARKAKRKLAEAQRTADEVLSRPKRTDIIQPDASFDG